MNESLKSYQVAGYECDQDSQLQVGTIFNWLQDSMDLYSRANGVGHDFCQKNNLTYIIKNYDVQIRNLPFWTDSVQMHTTLYNTTHSCLFFMQSLYDLRTKEQLLSSASQVVLIDLLRQRPARISERMPTESVEAPNIPLGFTPLKSLDRSDTTRTEEVSTDHIDFNQHVNNTN